MIHSIIFSFVISELEINLVNIKLKNDLRWFSEFFSPLINQWGITLEGDWRKKKSNRIQFFWLMMDEWIDTGKTDVYFPKGKFVPLFMKLSCSSKKIWRVSVIDKFTVFSINEKNLFNYWLKFPRQVGLIFVKLLSLFLCRKNDSMTWKGCLFYVNFLKYVSSFRHFYHRSFGNILMEWERLSNLVSEMLINLWNFDF